MQFNDIVTDPVQTTYMVFVTDRVGSEEDDENVAALGLGELADLTVFNEADTSSYDVSILSSSNHHFLWLLVICCPIDRTVASGVVGFVVVVGIVVVIIGICNRSQMRTSKCTCLIFGVRIGASLKLLTAILEFFS